MNGNDGLDQDTLAVYRAILIQQVQDPGAIAARLGSSPEEVSGAIERLVELSLLARSWEQPDRLRAVSPSLGLDVLLRHEQSELARRQQRLEETRSALASVAAEYSAQSRLREAGQFEELTGIDAIRTRLEELSQQCRHEVLAFHPDRALTAESIEAGRPLNERAIERGVRFRSIYLDRIVRDRLTAEHAGWMAERGSEIRTSPTLPMRLLVLDDRTAVVAGPPDPERPGALVISCPPVVHAMRALFESYWEQAQRLGEPTVPDLGGLTRVETRLLRLLADGLTDDAVSRALGLGVRTERRMVSDLMARLGAASRFQAGVRAARLDWV